jgi:uncharacterized protein DUF2442
MTLADADKQNRIAYLRFDDRRMYVLLHHGREISAPLWWHPRLLHAAPEQCNKWEILPFGDALHWPDIDEDLDVHGFLIGAKAPAGRGVTIESCSTALEPSARVRSQARLTRSQSERAERRSKTRRPNSVSPYDESLLSSIK